MGAPQNRGGEDLVVRPIEPAVGVREGKPVLRSQGDFGQRSVLIHEGVPKSRCPKKWQQLTFGLPFRVRIRFGKLCVTGQGYTELGAQKGSEFTSANSEACLLF